MATKDKPKKETEAERAEREQREKGQGLGEIYPNPTKVDEQVEETYPDPEEAARQSIRDKRDDQ